MAKTNYGINDSGQPMKTQVAVIRNYLEKSEYHRVSQKFVTERWGFIRLSAVIYNLKKQLKAEGGKQVIKSRRMSVANRFGNTTHPAEYWIENVE